MTSCRYLSLLVLSCIFLSMITVPLGYHDAYRSENNSNQFSLAESSSILTTSENLNLDSGQWLANGSDLSLVANGVADSATWAIMTVTATLDFPPLAGTELAFSGSVTGLNLTDSAVRVFLRLTHLSSVVVMYYLVGNTTVSSNTGSYSYYYASIVPNGGSFFAQRDIAQDLSVQGTGVDSNWELRSISFGFIIYPSPSNTQHSIQVSFNSNETNVRFSGSTIHSSYSTFYDPWYFFAPVLLLAVTLFLYASQTTLPWLLHPRVSRPRPERVPSHDL